MTRKVTPTSFEKYFQTANRADRLLQLKQWLRDGAFLTDAVTRGLFTIPISKAEQIGLLDITATENPENYEFWIFENLLQWSQDVAATALRSWGIHTRHQLWHRLIPILKMPGLPQRLSYTILDISPSFAGQIVTQTVLDSPGWEDFSPAYHGLLFDRAIQFDCKSKRLEALGLKIASNAKPHTHADDKSLDSALGWLMRCGHSKQLFDIAESTPYAAWKAMLTSSLHQHDERKKSFDRVGKALAKNPEQVEKAVEHLPHPWSRFDAPAELVQSLLTAPNITDEQVQAFANGMPASAVSACEAATGRPSLSAWLGNGPAATPELSEERKVMLAKDGSLSQGRVQSAPMKEDSDKKDYFGAARANFFEREQSSGQDFWSLLSAAWKQCDTTNLQPLAVESRKQKGLATLCYLTTLGRLKGQDEAVLKIMDHIRSSEEDELRAIVFSLGEINTSRSLQELIATITRPNATPTVQQEAVAVLSKRNVSTLQKELRATVQDLKVPADPTSPVAEIREALVNLLQVSEVENPKADTKSSSSSSLIDDKLLDEELGRMIPNYRALSSEVRKALRTALFFNQSIAGSEASHAIDLSPLIDMQYKAMELLFREFFEDVASQALHRGDIPRKLDVIGYARPIPPKMDEFENFIASLPVVREIPFFSKFKLRKMLRAICQFQPGKRFTLDGLKAFGLFFLCFSRVQCRFGLANMFPIGAKDDKELAEFARELHIFQDFRNRAAHEGFHPEASNDIQGIWRSTALIVQWAFRIRETLAQPTAPVSSDKKAS